MAGRDIVHITSGERTSDGAGVKMTRIIGTQELNLLDPFLLLDCFESDRPEDYIGGFPSHPHRGFETVTYLLAGRMRHKDNAGNEGVIEPGGVQWMTAGRGIVHSEMPEQENGLLMGFQLWVLSLMADLLGSNRKILENIQQRGRRAELDLERKEVSSSVQHKRSASKRGDISPSEFFLRQRRFANENEPSRTESVSTDSENFHLARSKSA